METILPKVVEWWENLHKSDVNYLSSESAAKVITSFREEIFTSTVNSPGPSTLRPVEFNKDGLLVLRKQKEVAERQISELTIGVYPAFGKEQAAIHPIQDTGNGVMDIVKQARRDFRQVDRHWRQSRLMTMASLTIKRTMQTGLRSMLAAALSYPAGPYDRNLTLPGVRVEWRGQGPYRESSTRQGEVAHILVRPISEVMTRDGVLTTALIDNTLLAATAQHVVRQLSTNDTYVNQTRYELEYCLQDEFNLALPQALKLPVPPASNCDSIIVGNPDRGGRFSELTFKLDHHLEKLSHLSPSDRAAVAAPEKGAREWVVGISFEDQLSQDRDDGDDLVGSVNRGLWNNVSNPARDQQEKNRANGAHRRKDEGDAISTDREGYGDQSAADTTLTTNKFNKSEGSESAERMSQPIRSNELTTSFFRSQFCGRREADRKRVAW